MVSNSPSTTGPMLAVAIGNTRIRWASFTGRELTPGGSEPLAEAVGPILRLLEGAEAQTVAIASVNDPAAREVEAALRAAGAATVRIGRDLMPPVRHTLDDASTLGIDRALCALAAFALTESAVAVIDAGTAITVDFVDGEGVFHGGAIAPGLNMMLRALHEQTAALPKLTFDPHATGPFGKSTAHAMHLGVRAAATGLVRDMVERFAVYYEAYPRILATGGDAAVLFEEDEFVERVIPDLQLIGIQRTLEYAMQSDGG